MRRALLGREVKVLDKAAEELGVGTALLMESAGAALAQRAEQLCGPRGTVVVLCGQGNNGGDGMVAARRLHGLGRRVLVELMVVPEALEGEPHRNYKALKAAGIVAAPIAPEYALGAGDVVVDALLGTGLNRPPDVKYAEAIARIEVWRRAGARVVAADLPSGLDSETGRRLEPCVRADHTVCFGHLKVGMVLEPGASLCGQVEVVDIGLPAAALGSLKEPAVWLLEEGDVRARLPERAPDSHKGSYGHVLVIAGSWGKTGAAALAGMAALRTGAGLVTVATRPEALVPVLAHAPEVMGVELVSEGPLGLGDLNTLLEAVEGKAAVVLGPGIPIGPETPRLLAQFLEEVELPVVIDADGLNALAGDLSLVTKARAPIVVTPHPGEMARLLDKSVADVQADRLGAARTLAGGSHVVVVLKGARTVIARDDGTAWVNPTGNPGLATAGTGDVLAGMLGGLLGQGLAADDAATVAVFAHGLAADLMAARRGMLGLVASDLLEGLGEVWCRWKR